MFKFIAPHVCNGNREPSKMDNVLVGDTSFFLVKAKPNPKP